jgi:hypothetical protein
MCFFRALSLLVRQLTSIIHSPPIITLTQTHLQRAHTLTLSLTRTHTCTCTLTHSHQGLLCHRLVAALRKFHNADNAQARSYLNYAEMHFGSLLTVEDDELARFANLMMQRLNKRIDEDYAEYGPMKSGRRERIRRLVEATTDPDEGKPVHAGTWERVAAFTVGDESLYCVTSRFFFFFFYKLCVHVGGWVFVCSCLLACLWMCVSAVHLCVSRRFSVRCVVSHSLLDCSHPLPCPLSLLNSLS